MSIAVTTPALFGLWSLLRLRWRMSPIHPSLAVDLLGAAALIWSRRVTRLLARRTAIFVPSCKVSQHCPTNHTGYGPITGNDRASRTTGYRTRQGWIVLHHCLGA